MKTLLMFCNYQKHSARLFLYIQLSEFSILVEFYQNKKSHSCERTVYVLLLIY